MSIRPRVRGHFETLLPRPYPSIALGVFEATPIEIAEAYTVFPNGGVVRPLRSITRLISAGRDIPVLAQAPWPQAPS